MLEALKKSTRRMERLEVTVLMAHKKAKDINAQARLELRRMRAEIARLVTKPKPRRRRK
jgi:hypothetical protein